MALFAPRRSDRLATVTVRINRRSFSFDLTSFKGPYSRIVCKGVLHDGAMPSECPLVPEGDFNPETSRAAWTRFRAECSFDRTTGTITAISDRLTRYLLAMARLTLGRDVAEKEIVLPSSRESGNTTSMLKGVGNDLMYGMIPDAPFKGPTARVFARAGFTKLQKNVTVCQSPLHKGLLMPTKCSSSMSLLRHGIPMCAACLDKHTNRYVPSSTIGRHRPVTVLKTRFRPIMLELLDRVLESDESRMVAGMIGPGTTAADARLFLCAPFLCFVGGLVEPSLHFGHVIPFSPEALRTRVARHTAERGMPLIVMEHAHTRGLFYKTFSTDCGPGQLRTTAVCLSISGMQPNFEVLPFYSVVLLAADVSRLLLYAPFVELFVAMLAGKLTTPITLRLTARGIGAATAAETDARDPPYSLASVQPTITAAECLVPELLHAAMDQHERVVVAGSLDASLNDPHIESFADGSPTTGLLAILARASFSAELGGQITLDTAIGGDLLPENPTERDHAVLRATQAFLTELDTECADTTLPFSDESIVPTWSTLMTNVLAPILPLRHPELVRPELRRSVMTPSPDDTRRRPRARPADTEAQQLEAAMFGSESPEPSPGSAAAAFFGAGGAGALSGDPGEHGADAGGPSDDSRDGIAGSDSADDDLGDLQMFAAPTKRQRFM